MSVCLEISCDGREFETPLSRYVAKVADMLELKDWKVYVREPEEFVEEQATNKPVFGRKLSVLTFHPGLEGDREEMRHTVVHELLHCHIDPATGMVQKDLKDIIESERVHGVFNTSYTRAMEYGVDGIASALEQHVPLPPAKWR